MIKASRKNLRTSPSITAFFDQRTRYKPGDSLNIKLRLHNVCFCFYFLIKHECAPRATFFVQRAIKVKLFAKKAATTALTPHEKKTQILATGMWWVRNAEKTNDGETLIKSSILWNNNNKKTNRTNKHGGHHTKKKKNEVRILLVCNELMS